MDGLDIKNMDYLNMELIKWIDYLQNIYLQDQEEKIIKNYSNLKKKQKGMEYQFCIKQQNKKNEELRM